MRWKNILKDVNLGGTYLTLQDGKELTTDNLDITLELKEVSGNYGRNPGVFGDEVIDIKDRTSRTTFAEYQYAFMPKLKGYVELYEGDTLVEKFSAEDIVVYFEGGSFDNIQTFPVPIMFDIELDFDEKPILGITMKVA